VGAHGAGTGEAAPEGLELREARIEDAPAIAELVNAVTIAEVGSPWTSVDEVHDDLTLPGRDPRFTPVVLVEQDGALAGYLSFDVTPEPPAIHVLAFVPRRLWGAGLSARLIHEAEERARTTAPAGSAGVAVYVSRFVGNEAAARLFEALGYMLVRTFWIMRIELDRAPPTPGVPDGIEIRTFRPGQDDLATHSALAEAFADHWGSPFPGYDTWRHHEIDGAGARFDPSLWFLATEGDEVVGAACCRSSSSRSEGAAQVSELAIRRPWRRRGIALALLHTAFAEIRGRGIAAAELAVDAQSPTGATRLYERAGMTEVLSWDVWEKLVGGRAG